MTQARGGPVGMAILRIALGLTLVFTWFDNVDKDLYGKDGFKGFLEWLHTPVADGGNGGSLAPYEFFLDKVVIPGAAFFGPLQLVVELAIGVALILGVGTRLASLLATLFFANLLLAYFGGEEWIWTYVVLTAGALAVFLGYGGRTLGIDQWLHKTRGDSPGTLVW
jgi:uncharacterized membrane protein YphA (DoxX/SURF4 family)